MREILKNGALIGLAMAVGCVVGIGFGTVIILTLKAFGVA